MTVAQPVPRTHSSRWIISPRSDLAWISGSAVAGYIYVLLNLVLHVPISFLWWFWSVGLDGTHIFGTTTRTYFDPEMRRGNRGLLFGSMAFFFALGPAMVLLGWKGYLALLVGVWAYYHVVRQHYGFMVLYKVKNRELDRRGFLLDRLLLGVTMIFPPFHRFFIHHPEELGVPRSSVLAHAEPYAWFTVGIVVLLWAWRTIRAGGPYNVPKLLLFAGVIPLHWITFATMSWQAAVPTVTIVHNIQYHALIWFHNKNRYAQADGVPGMAGRSLATYFGMALIFSALYRVPGFQLGRVSDLAFGFFCGFGLTHYWLDSRIWRVRHDPGLRQALAL